MDCDAKTTKNAKAAEVIGKQVDRTLITSTVIDAAERETEQLNCEDPAGDA